MRRSYIDKPLRLPLARSLTAKRSRGLPVLLALPLVAVFWLTIGLPALGAVANAAGIGSGARRVSADAKFGGSNKSFPTAQRTQPIATFAPSIVRAFLRSHSAGRGGTGAHRVDATQSEPNPPLPLTLPSSVEPTVVPAGAW